MNETQKNNAKTAHSKLTTWLTALGIPANWAKIGAGIIIGATIGALSTCQQSCANLPQPTAAQIHTAHELYHTITGKPCHITPVVDCKK